ncbi:MAG: WcaF family extracellular polysaccharide biosynthesis acetyltransferase [Ferruginibacter sp.]
MNKVALNEYNNSWYKPGPALKRVCWYMVNGLFFKSGIFPFSGLKRGMLRLFGGKVGKGVVIKPYVSVKYPWLLTIGNYCWIGEHVWIDNLAEVNISDNVCISQGALILCGNHDYTKITFDLSVQPIHIHEGAWVGAKSIVGPGTVLESHAVLTAGSVGTGTLSAYSIYRGNPAVKIKDRIIQ